MEHLPDSGQLKLQEDRVDSQELFRGLFLHAFRDRVRLPDGETAAREYVVHPGAVMVVPLLDGGDDGLRVVMERQFRYPMGKVMLEFPAGKLDPGENSLHCAQRELREETGYTATQWGKAGTLHPVIAYSTEFIDVWFARGLQPGERQLDTEEFLEVFDVPFTAVLQGCHDGAITDAKTLIGAFWLQSHLSGQLPLHWQSLV
ncbi:MAG: NUDIX hydrolase [Rhodoferax sp.]|nr:MAG: NUDIX hydrolase [Rhodoferax sp.]